MSASSAVSFDVSSDRSWPARSGCPGAAARPSNAAACPDPSRPRGGGASTPPPRGRPCRRSTPCGRCRSVSRVRAIGFSNGTPCQPSITWGARCPEPEDEPAAGQRVERRGGLCDQCGAPRVQGDDPGHQLDALGLAGQVREGRDGVEAVDLRGPQEVDTRRLEILGLFGELLGITAESDGRADLHGPSLLARPRRGRFVSCRPCAPGCTRRALRRSGVRSAGAVTV